MRISFRSKNINIAQIASKIGGGGHQKAAGATINTLSFNTAKIKILDIILQDYIQKYNINDFIIEYKND
jgi:nanoRNase/pAp phosphatase (c-di-AMP/oligoRNAs hydrolase)